MRGGHVDGRALQVLTALHRVIGIRWLSLMGSTNYQPTRDLRPGDCSVGSLR